MTFLVYLLSDEFRTLFYTPTEFVTSTDQRIGLDSEPFVWIGNPQSLLINGKGTTFDGCGGNTTDIRCLTTCNDTASLLSRINVEEGKTYRLRIINGAQLLPFNFAISGHNLTIIEADGTLTDPVVVSNFDITPGQRYWVLLTANNPDSSPYWIRTVSRGRDVVPQGWAILDYTNGTSTLPANGAAPDQPAWDDAESGPALDALLFTQDVSFYEESAAPEPLIVKARRTAQQDALAALPDTLDVTETPPTVWNYTDIVTGPDGPGNFSEATMPLVLRVQKGDIVDIVMHNSRALNGVAEVHPWHMHGYSFWITGQGMGTFDPDNATLNLENPVLRDTFTVWPLGWTAIRFHANNPGSWEFHCHIASHAILGMGLTIIDNAQEIPSPPPGATSCVDESLDPNDGEGGGDSTSGAADGYKGVAAVLMTGGFVTTALVVAWL